MIVSEEQQRDSAIHMHAQSFIPIQLFETPWTVACQVPLSMGLSRQQYWSGLPFPTPGEPASPASLALTGRFFYHCTTWEAQPYIYMYPFFSKLPSHPACNITLSRVPCAMQ